MSLNRYAKRRDHNESDIIRALESAGCQVWPLDQPLDLLVFNPRTGYLLVEVKNPDGFNRLTKKQKQFRAEWRGPWFVVRSVDEALELVLQEKGSG